MAWDKGFDFRASSGFVTDPANCTYVIFDTYPTTRNGVTFGWSANPTDARDRDNTVDPRLTGTVFGTSGTFRVDLPNTGNFAISLAVGDASFGQGVMALTVKDNSTTVITLSSMTTSAGEFYDATGVKRTTAANWVSGNASSTQAFASTILNVVISSAGNTTLSHLFISEVAAPIVARARIVNQAVNRAASY